MSFLQELSLENFLGVTLVHKNHNYKIFIPISTRFPFEKWYKNILERPTNIHTCINVIEIVILKGAAAAIQIYDTPIFYNF